MFRQRVNSSLLQWLITDTETVGVQQRTLAKELPLWFSQVLIISITDITMIKQLSGFQNCPRDANNGIHAATVSPYF